MTDKLIVLCTYLLAVSLATERLVALIKTIIPWLAKEPLDASGLVNAEKERYRTLALQLIALLAAFITAYLSTEFGPEFCDDQNQCWSTWLIAILSTGGSTFWSNVLGYVNAVKDIKKQERAEMRMKVAESAAQRSTSTQNISTL